MNILIYTIVTVIFVFIVVIVGMFKEDWQSKLIWVLIVGILSLMFYFLYSNDVLTNNPF